MKNLTDDELIRELRDRGYCLAVWQPDDVLMRARDLEIPLTRNEAIEICSEMDRKHDATVGITWDTIDIYINDYRFDHPYPYALGDTVEIQNDTAEYLQEYRGKLGRVTKINNNSNIITIEILGSNLSSQAFHRDEIKLIDFEYDI